MELHENSGFDAENEAQYDDDSIGAAIEKAFDAVRASLNALKSITAQYEIEVEKMGTEIDGLKRIVSKL